MSSFDGRLGSLRRTERLMSTDSVSLEEVITVYERIKKGRERESNKIFRNFMLSEEEDENSIKSEDVEIPQSPGWTTTNEKGTTNSSESSEEVNLTPVVTPLTERQDSNLTFSEAGERGEEKGHGHQPFQPMDFEKYSQQYRNSKYFYFSVATDLLHANQIEDLGENWEELFQKKYFWLNISDPQESDFKLLKETFKVNEMALAEIAEGKSEEKVETFRHHTFISFRLLGKLRSKLDNSGQPSGHYSEEMDFNMILFKNFIITTHRNAWGSIPDVLSFLYVITKKGKLELEPECVLFSILIELSQDAKYLLHLIEPEINNIRIGSKSLTEMSAVMRKNLDMEFQIYQINNFIKPKINVLRQILGNPTHSKNLSEKMKKHFNDACTDFTDLLDSLSNFNHIVERSQDTILALANVEHARLANGLAIAMNRIGEIALVFLPVQALAGFFGMNVRVPFQGLETTLPFWSILFLSLLIAIAVYVRSRSLSTKSEVTPLPVKLRGDLLYEDKLPDINTPDENERKNFHNHRRPSKLLKLRSLYSRISVKSEEQT